MSKYKIYLLFLLSLVLTACDKTNDFDLVCSYFNKLDEALLNDKLSDDEKFKYIDTLVAQNLNVDSPAKETWNAIMGYHPEEGRYALFKDAAEVTLKSNWGCDSMKKHLKDL